MRIAYITAGAADMYCGSCMRDNTLAAALIAQGHECLLLPTYTPIRTDEADVSEGRVFFGGIGIYLAQKSRLFRHLPGFVNRTLSRPGLLRWVSRKFGMKTRPEDLGDLTLSMLRGEHGHQRAALEELLRWLEAHRPDIVCITVTLLSGIVPELQRRLRVPVVMTLQGDDIFLDWLPAAHREQALALIRDNCRQVSAYIATCRSYADFMADYLGAPRERIHVVYPGIQLNGFVKPSESAAKQSPATVGYLARVCPEKGLHLLVDAFHQLLQGGDFPAVRLRVAGYLGERDRHYLSELRQRIEKQGWADRFEYVGEVDHAGKIAFLQSIDVFSAPTTYREPKGLYVLEAWAAGVPVVQPRHGSFPELVEMTGGGLLVEPESPAALAHGLREMLLDEERRRRLGELGWRGVREHFSAETMAAKALAVFDHALKREAP